MKTYGERLAYAMLLADNMSQSELARQSNVKQQSIQYLIDKGKGSSHTATFARILRVRPEWLAKGTGPMREEESSNVSPGPPIRGKVPLISWVQAGKWKEAIDLYAPGDAEVWIETTVPIKEHTFVLRVEGDSMEPDFPAGTLLVVEPDLDPQPGDYVIAKNGDEATFKQLVKDGADWYLKPLNERYPIKPLESPCKIIGVVREAARRFR